MNRTTDITLDWMKSKGIKFANISDNVLGKAAIYIKDTRWWRYQFDMYVDHMDICLSKWELGADRDDDEAMEDTTELCNLPFAADPKDLDSLMELAGYPIK